ncbi:MAG: DUF4170 domain-containing protein [Alphaproteobacteria bacterium]|nr:DUF4170 domain-containing protein [Rhodospirillales bacterium]MCW9045721.1 DUF4170 domain-containing protein [Alphaproteobacteria bacterium]
MSKNLPHLVFGGEVKDPAGTEFVDYENVEVVGMFGSYDDALNAWRAASQARVDEAHIKYVIVHVHRMMEPDEVIEPIELK